MSGTEIWISDFLSDTDSELKVNITKCLWKDTCDFFGCSEVCDVFCSANWTVFDNLKKLQLFRTETLKTVPEGTGNVDDDFPDYDPPEYEAMFYQAFELRLASKLALELSGKLELHKMLLQEATIIDGRAHV